MCGIGNDVSQSSFSRIEFLNSIFFIPALLRMLAGCRHPSDKPDASDIISILHIKMSVTTIKRKRNENFAPNLRRHCHLLNIECIRCKWQIEKNTWSMKKYYLWRSFGVRLSLFLFFLFTSLHPACPFEFRKKSWLWLLVLYLFPFNRSLLSLHRKATVHIVNKMVGLLSNKKAEKCKSERLMKDTD